MLDVPEPIRYHINMEKNQEMSISRRVTGEGSTIQDTLFGDYAFEVESFSKTHFFMGDKNNGIISTEFKEYLYAPFGVSNQEELIHKINGEWNLIVTDGNEEPTLDELEKTVTVFLGDYEKYYALKRDRKNAAKTAKALYDNSAHISSVQVTDILQRIADRSDDILFNKKQRDKVKKSIPKILSANDIHLDKQDLFDIEKVSIREIISLGRMLLKFDRRACKSLDVKDVHSEEAWQKYFEKFGQYLLFGSVTLEPKVCLDAEKTKELNNKYPDLITCNRYGFLDIIELKRSEFYLFKFDKSHNKLVPTPELSSALSQLNGYMQIIPYAFNVKESRSRALTCANGMIMIGDHDHLIKSSKNLETFLHKNNLSFDDYKTEAVIELRRLNYSYAHIQVVLYDDIIKNLEDFVDYVGKNK